MDTRGGGAGGGGGDRDEDDEPKQVEPLAAAKNCPGPPLANRGSTEPNFVAMAAHWQAKANMRYPRLSVLDKGRRGACRDSYEERLAEGDEHHRAPCGRLALRAHKALKSPGAPAEISFCRFLEPGGRCGSCAARLTSVEWADTSPTLWSIIGVLFLSEKMLSDLSPLLVFIGWWIERDWV